MKSSTIEINLFDSRFKLPTRGVTVDLFVYRPTVSDGTITGIQAVDTTGKTITAITDGDLYTYKFKNVPRGKYSVVVSGNGIAAHIPNGLDEIEVLPYDITGSDLAFKDNSVISIATKLDMIQTAQDEANQTFLDVEDQISSIEEQIGNTANQISSIEEQINNISIAVGNIQDLNGNQYNNIQSAINDATDGSVITVKSGTYVEPINIVTSGVELHLEDGANIISPTDSPALTVSTGNFKLSGSGNFYSMTEPGVSTCIRVGGEFGSTTEGVTPNFHVKFDNGYVYYSDNMDGVHRWKSNDGKLFTYITTPITLPIRSTLIFSSATNRNYVYNTEKIYSTQTSSDPITEQTNWKTIFDAQAENIYLPIISLQTVGTDAFFITPAACYIVSNIGTDDNWRNRYTLFKKATNDQFFKLVKDSADNLYLMSARKFWYIDCVNKTTTEIITGLAQNSYSNAITYSASRNKFYMSTNDAIYTTTSSGPSCSWSKIDFPVAGLSFYDIEILNDTYLFCLVKTHGVFRTSIDVINWECVNKGIRSYSDVATNSFFTNIDDRLYAEHAGLGARLWDGECWTLTTTASSVVLEFNKVQNLGPADSPGAWCPAINVDRANIVLRGNEVISNRSGAVYIRTNNGYINADIGRVETGLIGQVNGSTGSTAVITNGDGYYRGNEIIVNNVGHTISHRGGIMHFDVKRLYQFENSSIFAVQSISQINNQADMGTASIIEFDECINAVGSNYSPVVIWKEIGYMTLKGRKLGVYGKLPMPAWGKTLHLYGETIVQIDEIFTDLRFMGIACGAEFPYYQYYKNCKVITVENSNALFTDQSTSSIDRITLENCSFEIKNLTTETTLNAAYPTRFVLKGVNTFNGKVSPNLSFSGQGILINNGVLYNYPLLTMDFTDTNTTRYYISPKNLTIQSVKEAGTGTVAYSVSTDNGLTFTTKTLPIILAEGNILKVSCTGFSIFKTITLLT